MHYMYSLAIYAHSVYNDSLIHAIEHGTDAASGWILEELEEGNDIPAPSNQKDIALEDDSFISLLVLDMNSYSEKYRSKTVRKNITIPFWHLLKNDVYFFIVLTQILKEHYFIYE